MKHWLIALVVAGGLWCHGAAAQTCTVSTSAIAFGAYNPGAASPTTTNGSVSITCSAVLALNVTYSIALTAGRSNSFASRTMVGTKSPNLLYQVYSNAALSTIWGDGTGGSSIVSDGYGLQILVPISRSYTAYASAPARQFVNPGSYTDSLTVQISY